MSAGRSLPISAALFLFLSACSFVEKVRYYSAEVAGRAVALECALSPEERMKNLAAINGWLAAANVTNRATAFDCDGDGSPDF